MDIDIKIDLIRTFLQVEGNMKIDLITHNYDYNDGILFTGHAEVNEAFKKFDTVNIAISKHQIDALSDCNTIDEIYNCYKEMEYFKTT